MKLSRSVRISGINTSLTSIFNQLVTNTESIRRVREKFIYKTKLERVIENYIYTYMCVQKNVEKEYRSHLHLFVNVAAKSDKIWAK